jgi:hypothetical protein
VRLALTSVSFSKTFGLGIEPGTQETSTYSDYIPF